MTKTTTSKTLAQTDYWSKWLRNLLVVLLVVVPFHAFLVIVLGHSFGHQLLWASWKEVIELGLIGGVGVIALLTRRLDWLKRKVNLALLLVIAGGGLASLLTMRFDTAWLVGVKTTVLPLLLFIAVQPLADRFSTSQLEKLVLIPALVVAALAIKQFVLVPTTWLQSIGYGPTTILPFQSVHPGFDFARSFSTLGGPNQLGAYLILPAIWLFVLSLSKENRRQRMAYAVGFCLVMLGLVASFSRSALIGLAVGLVVATVMYIPTRWRWWALGLIAGGGVLAWLSIVVLVQQSPNLPLSSFFLRGTLSATGIVGGDSGHVNSITQGLNIVVTHPLGFGFGAAGPASFYSAQPLLTENWWLQIALETGVIGLLAMITAWGGLAKQWYGQQDELSRVALASLIGLAAASMFLHSFADSTLAITFFAVAGLIFGRTQMVVKHV